MNIKRWIHGITARQWVISSVLFVATMITTTFIGGISMMGFYQVDISVFHPLFWVAGLAYSLPLMAILIAHELGHFLMARHYGMASSPPYFIPAPSLIGTFGAFIRIRSPFYGRRDLFDVGIAGPIAGFVVAVPVLVGGLMLSTAVPTPPDPGEIITFGQPLLYKFIRLLVFPNLTDETYLLLHPVGFAGWIGMLVTSLNLLPVGQLDGGHIAYAVFGKRASFISYILIGVLLIASFFYQGWLLWIAILLFLGLRHPALPYLDPPLDPARKRLAIVALIIFILSFMPVPVNLG